MYPVILIQFRMKCQSILLFILYSYNISIHLSQYFCAFPAFLNIRGANECHGNLTDSFHFPDGVKTAKLSAVGISFYCHRHGSEIHMPIIREVVSQKDHPCTSGKHRHSSLDFLFQRLKHFQLPKEFSLYRTLPAWQNQSVKVSIQVFFFPQLHAPGTQFFQFALMFCKSSLHSKDSDFHLICPSLPSEAGFPAH